MPPKTRTLKVDYLARVEGEGAMLVKIQGDRVTDVKLRIYEPPRFFEAFLRGRSYLEAPDITARICGICPVAYQMSAVNAIEDALGLTTSEPVRKLRRLLYCGEWIESHVLHVFMLHAPDFLGYEDAIKMGADHPEILQQALRMKKAGNEIVRVLGGREIHPINVRIGGFYKAPEARDLRTLLPELEWSRDTVFQSIKWAAKALPMPELEADYEFVSLRHETDYPMAEGRIVASSGLDISVQEYESYFEEIHVPHSNALHSLLKDCGAYFVGPMARYNLNRDRLSPLAQEAAAIAGLGATCRNPFQSILVRLVETLYAFDEAIRIVNGYERPESSFSDVPVRAGSGCGASEAPRGLLYHRYAFNETGSITDAKIVPPTSQNQKTIEDDLRRFVERNISLSDKEMTWRCEQAIRNYDPCISCATHFLKLDVVRGD